jgi:hypothetical protein
MKLNSQRVIATTRPRALTWAVTTYSRAQGVDMFRQITTMTRSDTIDTCECFVSPDNGKTWTFTETLQTKLSHPDGTLRRHPRGGFVDTSHDRFIAFRTEGVLPTDHPLEGMKHWTIRYRVSHDGGKTFISDDQVIQQGAEYSSRHPVFEVNIGQNSMMIGDFACAPIVDKKGRILHPCQISPPGPDGNYVNRGGGHTWHEAAVLIGTWSDDHTLIWQISQRVAITPDRSTRGLIEPTIAFLPDGRLLMVMRGSNDAKPVLPGHKWYTLSDDGGFTWGPVQPWAFSDGTAFFSPSSCSQLLTHSGGKMYWLGNISPTNPTGNLPRRPFVIAEVDTRSALLKRDTVFVIDDKREGDSDKAWFSNFFAYEDRVTHEVVLNMARAFCKSATEWTSDAFEYRIDL